MAELVEQVTGLRTMFLVDSYGTFGQVTWLSGAPDLATGDAAGEAIEANPDYLKRLSDVGDLFVPGSGQRRMVDPHRLTAAAGRTGIVARPGTPGRERGRAQGSSSRFRRRLATRSPTAPMTAR